MESYILIFIDMIIDSMYSSKLLILTKTYDFYLILIKHNIIFL